MSNNSIVGIDEAGRGCLAGPVVAAAVMLNQTPPLADYIAELNDSKKLSAKKREQLALAIKKNADAWGIGISWPQEIDSINILQASLVAMARAVANLKYNTTPVTPTLLLIDGTFIIPLPTLRKNWTPRFLQNPPLPEQKAIIQGDGLEAPISAASILAKTFRDALMVSLGKKWTQHAFAKHKGYGTKEHIASIQTHGTTPIHRMTFQKVKPEPAQLSLF